MNRKAFYDLPRGSTPVSNQSAVNISPVGPPSPGSRTSSSKSVGPATPWSVPSQGPSPVHERRGYKDLHLNPVGEMAGAAVPFLACGASALQHTHHSLRVGRGCVNNSRPNAGPRRGTAQASDSPSRIFVSADHVTDGTHHGRNPYPKLSTMASFGMDVPTVLRPARWN